MRVNPEYISIGANRSSSCSVCTSSGIIAYGAGKLIALWDSEDQSGRGVYATLPGHKAHVTTFKQLKGSSSEGLVSGDAEGSVRVWEGTSRGQYKQSVAFNAHPGMTISALGVPPKGSSSLRDHIFTGGSDGVVKLWHTGGGKATEVEKLDLKGKLPLELEIASLPDSDFPILVIGCTDRRIQIWTRQNGAFRHALSLEGHEDWVRALAFTSYPSSSSSSASDLLLASGSQDNYIRLWRVSATPNQPETVNGRQGDGLDMLDEFERKLAGEAGGQISTKAHVLVIEDAGRTLRYNITLEALLIGHEAGLTDLHWSPPQPSSPPILLSSACDNSMIIWSPSAPSALEDGIWVAEHRFGAIGGRGLGFYGALWGSEGKSVIATGWNGGVERWVISGKGVEEEERWEPKAGPSGHYGEVRSIVWDPRGEYLLSVGSDKTSRIHAPCSAGPSTTWAEIARPQIHGYDMTDAAFISPLQFVSGADEKVTRVFDAPSGFVESLEGLGVASSCDREAASSRPKGATVPPLSLSNRALGGDVVTSDMPTAPTQNPSHHSISRALTSLPTEEELASSTLWPEVEKIYGHGYEIVAVAASHDGKLIATTCKATNPEHAVVRVVSTTTWDLVGQPLVGHNLTITRIAFSPDEERILTCSRDRGWRIFRRIEVGEGYKLEAKDEKAHARMVLDCAWSPDGRSFATASRDKTVKIWTQGPNGDWTSTSTVKLEEAATAVDATLHNSQVFLAIGTESGSIAIHTVSTSGENAKEVLKLDQSVSHVGPVNRVAWQSGEKLRLGSCSDDRSVRIFELDLEEG